MSPCGESNIGLACKNCDRALENAARGHSPRAAFSSPPSQFFTIRTDPKPANNIFFLFFPAVNWLTSGFVCATFYKPFAKKKQANERVIQILDKERCIKNRFISRNYFMLVAFSLPVTFSTLNWNWLSFYLRDTAPSYKELNTLTTSKSVIGFTYNDFPCNLKVNRDKLALINRLWKGKKSERLTITANSFTKIDQKIPLATGTNQITGFLNSARSWTLTSAKKDNP